MAPGTVVGGAGRPGVAGGSNMTTFRRLAIGVVGLSLVVSGGVSAWLIAADPAVASVKVTTLAATEPNGVNFTIHTELDPSYCMEDTPAPAVPASEASMSQCVARDGQDWTFADAADGSVVIIGGNTGKCLDFSAKVHSDVSMTPCTFSAAERFHYARDGQIELASGKKCLEPAQAAQDAVISIAKCQKGVKAQIWPLGH